MSEPPVPPQPSHPEPSVLARFAGGQGTPEERKAVMRHLLRGCGLCSAGIRDLLWDGAAEPAAEELYRRLEAMTPRRQSMLAGRSAELHRADLVELLLAESRRLLHSDADRVLRLSRLAARISDRLPAAGAEGSRKRADLRAGAWGSFGNALRLKGRLREAEAAFAAAQRHLEEGSGDPRLKAMLLRQLSTLLSHQRRFGLAVEQVREAGRIYRGLGALEEVARCLVKEAIFHGYGGDADAALHCVAEAIPLIVDDRNLWRQALQAACRFALDAGHPVEAAAILRDSRELFTDAEPLDALRRTWLSGEVAHALGRPADAERDLLEARQGFAAAGLPYEAALISLELAALYTEAGRRADLERMVTEMIPVFESLKARRETLAALALVRQAQRQEEVKDALPLLRKAARSLRPGLRPRR